MLAIRNMGAFISICKRSRLDRVNCHPCQFVSYVLLLLLFFLYSLFLPFRLEMAILCLLHCLFKETFTIHLHCIYDFLLPLSKENQIREEIHSVYCVWISLSIDFPSDCYRKLMLLQVCLFNRTHLPRPKGERVCTMEFCFVVLNQCIVDILAWCEFLLTSEEPLFFYCVDLFIEFF